MTITTYPADAVAGEPVYSGRKLRQTNISPFVALGSTARPLGARSGLRPGTPDSAFSISGTTWSVGQHAGIIDTATASESGAYAYANDAAVTGTITAASASIIRWDGVFAQLTDPAETPGSGTPRVDFIYVAGTVASTMPATPARSFPLMRIVVPVNGTGTATAVPIAPFAGSAGAAVEFRTKAELDQWSTNVPLRQKAVVKADPNGLLNGDYWRETGGWAGNEQAKWTTSYSGVPDSQLLPGLGVYTAVSADTTDTDFVSLNAGSGGVSTGLTLSRPGLYEIEANMTNGAPVTGRTFVEAVLSGKGRRGFGMVNDEQFSVSLLVRVGSTPVSVTLRFLKTSGGNSAVTGNVYVTRIR